MKEKPAKTAKREKIPMSKMVATNYKSSAAPKTNLKKKGSLKKMNAK